MYKCRDCGAVFDEPYEYEEDFGVDKGYGFWSAKQTFAECPNCGSSDYEEAVECGICNEWTFAENGNICEYCLKANADLPTALEFGAENSEKVELNGYLAWQFTREEIESILTEYCNKNPQEVSPEDYCLEDKSYFGEWLDDKKEW